MHNLGSLILFTTIVLAITVSQVTWARCICDPADSSCLDGCVNSARDCIEGCNGKSGDSCFTSCINLHWPGTTFEDAEQQDDVLEQQESENTVTTTNQVVKGVTTATTNSAILLPTETTNEIVIPIGTAATTAPPPADVIPFLISLFGGAAAQTTDIPTVPLTNFPIAPFNTLGSSVMTTHTTITNLITITPTINATTSASANASHGNNLVGIDAWILSTTGFFLLITTWFLV